MPAFIAKKELKVACLFEPDKDAPLTDEYFTRINYEGYLFCQREERDRFLADPITFCGLLTDPVSKRRFRPTAESPRAEHEDVLYFFEGRSTARLFAKTPGDYRLPGYKMERMEQEDGGAEAEVEG